MQSTSRAHRLAAAVLVFSASQASAVDASAPPALQYFEGTYQTQINRTADIFLAGYGTVWIPPTGRASTGNQSVGYDVRDRFDLGHWRDKTLYGTEAGLRQFAARVERAGGAVLVDLVWNHNGFQYDDTTGFMAAGGYPGMVVQDPDGGSDPFGVPGTNGDFHSPFGGGFDSRFGGLIDINHASNHQLIRNPVTSADSRNIPAGTGNWFGYRFNVPDASNARFYPDRDLPPIRVFNPGTGQSDIPIYPFNRQNPMSGDALPENALGYLMRNAQWMVQDVGVEGFRLDVPWHFPEWVLNYFDQAVYRASPRRNLDGSQYHAFSFMEAGDGPQAELIRRFVRKTINPNDTGRVGSNYDALDFNFMRNVVANLSNNGFQNDWNRVVYSSLDHHDDGKMNGSAGVKFVQSHDDTPAHLNNVAHAYMLMLPGQANVYFNAKQHGAGRDFPRNGRGDALGGVYGSTLTRLLEIRNSHGRGDFRERLREKETYLFERGNAAIIGLSNRLDTGYTQRRVTVDFPWGSTLIELTGNSAAFSEIPDLVTVDDDMFQGPRKATIRVPHNGNGDRGYVIYGLPTPRSIEGIRLTENGQLLTVLPGGVPQANDFSNGATRLADLHVVTGDSFALRLETQAVSLVGRRLENGQLVQRTIRDRDADGDNALFRVDGGLNLNNANPYGTVSGVDFDTSDPLLNGFEQFTTLRAPGYSASSGNGRYEQVIDATLLPEGEHYVTVRVFRRRADGGPAVYSDFKRVLYVDRFDPISAVADLVAVNQPGSGDRDVLIESVDLTADRVHVFTNLPAALSEASVLSMAQAGQGQGQRVDANLFKSYFAGLPEGNNVLTVVTFEITGNSSVQRFPGQQIADGRGAGLGDLNHDGALTTNDIAFSSHAFENVLYSRDQLFNPAADFDADGFVGWVDLIGLGQVVAGPSGSPAVVSAYEAMLRRRGDVNRDQASDARDIVATAELIGSTDWYADLNSSGDVNVDDVDALIRVVFATEYGDADLDRRVGIGDFALLAGHFNQPGGWGNGDFSLDGEVSVVDFAILAANFGFSASSAQRTSLTAVPEPITGALLLLAILPIRARRIR